MQPPPNAIPEESLPNNLLLASPSLRDGCFNKSVVFMLEHNSEGSLGVILNHPTGKRVSDLISSNDFSPLASLPVFFGGPVESDQLILACFDCVEPTQIRCQLRIPLEQAVSSLAEGKTVKAFVGHSAWTTDQLHEELEQLAWFTAPANPTVIGQSAEQELWSDSLQNLSNFHHIISLTPENPFLN